jgi:hypothetical protein
MYETAVSVPTLSVQNVQPRSRLTTFFRLIIAIPWMLWAALWGLAAFCVTIVAWFVLLFTGRWPEGWYAFVSSFARYYLRVYAFSFLLTDPFPPFDGDEHPEYPAQLQIGPPQTSYDRMKVLLRIFYIIPAYIVAYIAGIGLELIGFISWLAILFTGRQPDELQNALRWCLSWSTRLMLLGSLLTETYDLNVA